MVASRTQNSEFGAPGPLTAAKRATVAATIQSQRRSQSEGSLPVQAQGVFWTPAAPPPTRSIYQAVLPDAVDNKVLQFGQDSSKVEEELNEEDDNLKTEKTRRSLALITRCITGAIEKQRKGDDTEYQDIIQQLTTKSNSTIALSKPKLLLWIRALSRVAAYLTRSCHSLVDAALSLDWASKDACFADGYIRFLGNLVSAHAFYVDPVIVSLVRGFHWRTVEDLEPEERARKFHRVHTALQFILHLIPTATTSLSPILAAEFPNRWESANEQVTFLHNALQCTLYAPVVRDRLLAVAVDRVIQMDVEVQNDDLLDNTDDESEDSDEEAGEIENGIFQCDIQDSQPRSEMSSSSHYEFHQPNPTTDESDDVGDDGEVSVVGDVQDEEEVKRQQVQSVEKLDGLMKELFGYFDAQHALAVASPAFARDSWASLRRSLLDLFERHILPTYRCRHAPFLIYRFCCIDPSMPDLFLGLCATKLLDRRSPDVTRIAAAAYVASYTARDRRLTRAAVRASAGLLVGWCNAYIDNYENGRAAADSLWRQFTSDATQQPSPAARPPPLSTPVFPALPSPDAERHAVFYAVAQAAMYVFCFRWKELRLASDEGAIAEAAAAGTTSALGASLASSSSSTCHSMSLGDNQATAIPVETQSPPVLAHAPFMETRRRPRAWAPQLDGFERIITSRFAPLRMMSRPVANQFARLSRRLGFLYCHPLLLSSSGASTPLSASTVLMSTAEMPVTAADGTNASPGGPRSKSTSPVPVSQNRNQHQTASRRTLAASQRCAASSSFSTRAPILLDEFFPFDPYKLPSTRGLVEPFYHTWAMASVGLPAGESDSESESDSDGADSKEDEDDRKETEDNEDADIDRKAMSVSPAFAMGKSVSDSTLKWRSGV